MFVSDYKQQEYNEECREVWITSIVPIEKPINGLWFDLEFTSDPNADGMLTVFLDKEVIGVINEIEATPEKQEYVFEFPTKKPGEYELSFRLVPHTDVKSSINVSNVRLGLVTGVRRGRKVPKFNTKINPIIDFSSLPRVSYNINEVARIGLEKDAITLRADPDSPAWIIFSLNLQEEINLLKFDMEYTSQEGAEGLVSILIDGQSSGMSYDERYKAEGVRHFEMMTIYTIDGEFSNIQSGPHQFSIRLDTYSEIPSSVRVSNMQTGLVSKIE